MNASNDVRRIVIVGAGAGGCTVAAALRRKGFDGSVVVLDEDVDAPYDRPPLSKSVLTAEAEDIARLRLPLPDDVELHGGVRVVSCDTAGRTVVAEDGRVWEYDDLVIAAGVSAADLPNVPDDVITLRTWRDAQVLRKAVRSGSSTVVIGAGFLGLEVAATASELGNRVTVVAVEQAPLANRLGVLVADRLLETHRSRGVEVLCGARVDAVRDSVESGDGQLVVELTDGRIIAGDNVVVAIGSRPRTEWIDGVEFDADGGIRCDDSGRAAPHVWAVGDVARWFEPLHGQWARHEHRSSATEQGVAVAHALMNEPPPVSRAPFFWTDQYDVKVQVWGTLPDGGFTRVLEGESDSESFVLGVSELPDGEPNAILAWNATRAAVGHRLALDKRLAAQAVS